MPGSPDTLLVASADWPSEADASAGAVLTLPIDTTGRLGPITASVAVTGPSYLAYGPDGRHVYASCRWPADSATPGASRKHSGEVAAIVIGPDAHLTVTGRAPTAGHSPCHLTVDAAGCHVLVADYQDGLIDVHPVDRVGGVGDTCSVAVRGGSGPDARQQSPHAHMVREHAPDGRFLVADLGTDEIAAYDLDHASGQLSTVVQSTRLEPGSGPRHFVACGPDLLFVATELRAGVVTLALDPGSASFQVRAVVSSTRHDLAAPSAIVLSPDGRHLYVGNRGPDTIGVLRIEVSGLRLVDEVPCNGQPRDLTFLGDRLYVANQESGTIAVLRYDAETGGLDGPIQVIEIPAPTCMLPYHRTEGRSE